MTKEEVNNLQVGEVIGGYPFAGIWHTVEVISVTNIRINKKGSERVIWLRIASECNIKGLVTNIPANSNVFKNAYKVEKKVSILSKVKSRIMKIFKL